MTRTQGWILIIVVAFAVGWYIQKDVDSWPTASERAMADYHDIMGRFFAGQ